MRETLGPWVFGVLVLITLPMWLALLYLLGGMGLMLWGLYSGGPLGALAIFTGMIWTIIAWAPPSKGETDAFRYE